MGSGGGVFVVDLLADAREGGAGVALCFECEADADDFEGVGEEDGGDAGEGAADQPAEGGFLGFVFDDDGAYLLVGEEFDGCVREDTQESGGVASEESSHAVLSVDVPHGGHDAEP